VKLAQLSEGVLMLTQQREPTSSNALGFSGPKSTPAGGISTCRGRRQLRLE